MIKLKEEEINALLETIDIPKITWLIRDGKLWVYFAPKVVRYFDDDARFIGYIGGMVTMKELGDIK